MSVYTQYVLHTIYLCVTAALFGAAEKYKKTTRIRKKRELYKYVKKGKSARDIDICENGKNHVFSHVRRVFCQSKKRTHANDEKRVSIR